DPAECVVPQSRGEGAEKAIITQKCAKTGMSVEKILEKLLRGESDANIRFEELCHLLQAKGFRMRVSGSHHIFTRPGVMERINLQREGSRAKPYQVKQVRKILAKYKLV